MRQIRHCVQRIGSYLFYMIALTASSWILIGGAIVLAAIVWRAWGAR